MEGLGSDGGVGDAGAGEEVGEGRQGGFERGDLGGIVANVGLVCGEPLSWESSVGSGDAKAGGEGGCGR